MVRKLSVKQAIGISPQIKYEFELVKKLKGKKQATKFVRAKFANFL